MLDQLQQQGALNLSNNIEMHIKIYMKSNNDLESKWYLWNGNSCTVHDRELSKTQILFIACPDIIEGSFK